MKTFRLALLCLIPLAGCHSAVTEQEGLIVLSQENTKIYPKTGLFVSDLVESVELIPLENSEQALLHSVYRMDADEGLFFIFSSPNTVTTGVTLQEIKVFDASGKFRHNIGIFGRGPREYTSISKWALDKNKKQVLIYDGSHIIRYAYDGSFIESIEAKPLAQVYSMTVLPGGNMLALNWFRQDIRASHILMDPDFNITDTLAYLPFSFVREEGSAGGMLSLSGPGTISVYQDNVLFVPPLCDTVFSYKDGHIQPAYYVSLVSSKPKNFSFRPEYKLWEFHQDLRDQGFDNRKSLRYIFETDNYCIFVSDRYSLWHKQSQKGLIFGGDPDVENLPGVLVCTDQNSLICAIDALGLVQYKEKCEEEGRSLPSQIQALFDAGFSDEDNPVLFRYQLKTKGVSF